MSAEVSDQVVKMMLDGVEVSAKIAGKATKHLVAYLYALMSGDKKISGNTSVAKIISQSKNIRVFSIKDEDLECFKVLAKKYGMLYSVIRDKNLGDGLKDIMVKGEDASKLQRVFDIMGYGDVDRDEKDRATDDDKKKQASRREPESRRSRQEHAKADRDSDDVGKTSSENNLDLQPSSLNGGDEKDSKQLPPPATKAELAEQLHGKSIGSRKDIADSFIKKSSKLKQPTKKLHKDK